MFRLHKNKRKLSSDKISRVIALSVVTVVVGLFVIFTVIEFFYGTQTYDTSKYTDVGDGLTYKNQVLDYDRIVDRSELDD